MEKIYLLQVRDTYYETTASTVKELEEKGKALKARWNLSGFTYRIFIGTRESTDEFFKFGKIAKDSRFL